MSLLWKQAMAWVDLGGPGAMSAEEARAKPVKKAGFKGYVGPSVDQEQDLKDNGLGSRPPGEDFDEHLWNDTWPEPTKAEDAHYAEHGDYPDSHHERREQAYTDALSKRSAESTPDHRDEGLHDFVREHGDDQSLWQSKGKLKSVSLHKGVYATQSHVGQKHVDRYLDDPDSMSWHQQAHGVPSMGGDYLGHNHPMFVKHQGRLHCIEGHHRVAAALQRGDSRVHGWYYDADKHGFPEEEY